LESQDPKISDWQDFVERFRGEPLFAESYPQESLEQTERERAELRIRFPHVVTLEGTYDGIDRAERYCWEHFGPRDGICFDSASVCLQPPDPGEPRQGSGCSRHHSHNGTWTAHWIEKTDYDYGFCDMCFAIEDQKTEFVSEFLSSP
jgi:hypothetical protein